MDLDFENNVALSKGLIKPTVLYHASPNKEIELFEPRNEKSRDPKEGPVVFGAPRKDVAAMFIVRTDGSWVSSGLHNHVPYIAISDKERFTQADVGGAIYYLSPETFINNPDRGLEHDEWVSKVSVKPFKKEIYDSGLQAMLENGIQVYFLSSDEWRQLKESSDHGFTFLPTLQSENQKLGINIRSFNP